jgi:hypothetical protein
MTKKRHARILVLGIMLIIPGIAFSESSIDSVVLHNVYNYAYRMNSAAKNYSTNVYLKYYFHTAKKNPTLLFVPTMYTIASGNRNYFGETYIHIIRTDVCTYTIQPQVRYNTFSKRLNVMPTLFQYLTPEIYNVSLIKDQLLSPFNKCNHHYYKYRFYENNGKTIMVDFRPKIRNTQLVKGNALIEIHTGKVINTSLNGEYDMIKFKLDIVQGEDSLKSLYPKKCRITSLFKFLGNRILVNYDATYDCPTTLNDSICNRVDSALISKLRTEPLSDFEQNMYNEYNKQNSASDTLKMSKPRRLFIGLGNDLINSIQTQMGKQTTIKFSPILNPFYFSYSHSKGLSYKFVTDILYNVNDKSDITFEADLGYNLKQKLFYFTTPLRFNYNLNRDGYIELKFGNGNRITNSSVLDQIKAEKDSIIDFKTMNLDYFNDMYLELYNHIDPFKWLEVSSGFIFHRRSAVNKGGFDIIGRPSSYKSFAPLIALKFIPWQLGPVFSCNYERGIKGIINSDIEYERWEFDAVYKMKILSLRALSFRIGGGFYTNKNTKYFVDYANFQDHNLPERWNDDWSGNFQLLDAEWYNSSEYYVRSNFTYETPMFCLKWVPLLGKYIEMERIYINTLWVDNLHPYSEIGYGFTNRVFSMALFVNSLNNNIQTFGCKFTFEIFSNW